MTDFTPPTPSYQLYQMTHTIAPVATEERGVICAVDGIRIHPVIGGWRHDQAQIVALFDAWVQTIWPGSERAEALR